MPSRQERRKVSVGVDLVLDLDQRVQNHRPALVEIDLVGVEPRVLAVVGIPAIDLEGLDALGARPAPDRSCRRRPWNCAGSVNSTMRLPCSVDPRLGREGLDLVRQRVDDAPGGSRACTLPLRVEPGHACASSSSRRRGRGNPRAHGRRGFPCGSRAECERHHRLRQQIVELQRLDQVAVPDQRAVGEREIAHRGGDVGDLARRPRSSVVWRRGTRRSRSAWCAAWRGGSRRP